MSKAQTYVVAPKIIVDSPSAISKTEQPDEQQHPASQRKHGSTSSGASSDRGRAGSGSVRGQGFPVTLDSSTSLESRTKKAVARGRDEEESEPEKGMARSASTSKAEYPREAQPAHLQHPPHPGQPDDISPAQSASSSPVALQRRLSVPANLGPNVLLSAGHFSMQGIRPEMEDRVTMLTHPELNHLANIQADGQARSFYAVFDGHGGDVSAEYCRQHVHNNLINSQEFQEGRLADAMRAALVKTEDDFCAACRRINLLTSSGTTAITAYVQADVLVVANVGDSRAVLCRSGRALDASIDHKPGRKEERTRIEALGGRVGITEEDAFRATPRPCACLWACVSAGRPLRVFPGGLSVSRTIGDISMKYPPGSALVSSEPELFETRLTAADEFMILACDGTWDVMSSAQAVDYVRGVLQRSNHDASVAARALANEAFKRGSTDNISCVIVVFDFPLADGAAAAAAASAGKNGKVKPK